MQNNGYIREEGASVFYGTKEFAAMMNLYDSAARLLKLKFEVLNDEFNLLYARNLIHHIESRLKSADSIIAKLIKKNLPLNIESAMKNVNDIAGVRVVCNYIDDVYSVAEMFARQPDLTVVKRQDYIANPNYNGYRSLHLDVKVPVCRSTNTEYVVAEVQIRTIAMDFWASLEHTMKYKKDIDDADSIMRELKECADVIASTDIRMQEINKKLHYAKPSE